MTRFCLITYILLLAGACTTPPKMQQKPVIAEPVTTSVPADSTRTDAFLENLLLQYPQFFGDMMKNRNAWNVQIIYTQIDRGANGIPALRDYYFNVNPARYFYPASTVKFPVCMLALQRLNELKDKGINMNTTMITEAEGYGQTPVYNDPNTPNGKPNIAQYIKKILLVSDNDAYNRLYEFLGRRYTNEVLHQKGYRDIQLLHRLQLAMGEEGNSRTNPIRFLDANGNTVYEQAGQTDTLTYLSRKDTLGTGYYSRGQLVNTPMDFSRKNRISLEDLHRMLIGLVFPNKIPSAQRFNLTAADRNFLLKYMSQYPGESIYPAYDTVNYWDAYCKFIYHGSEKGVLPKNLRVFNKVGDAYGHLLDVAYVVDFEKKIEFFVSAVIYCNSDGILNDDKYEYDSIGFPFMKNIGRVLYNYELTRPRKIIPDLSGLQMIYDK
jgi:beta-lactamase class A